MNPNELLYRTVDGQEDYRFHFEEQDNGKWKVYILYHPPYGNAPQDLPSTHRQYDSKGKYIDWHPPPESFEEAKQIAAMWAEHTQDHIKNKKGKQYARKKGYNYEPDPEDPCAQDNPPGSLEGDLHDWLSESRDRRNSRRQR